MQIAILLDQPGQLGVAGNLPQAQSGAAGTEEVPAVAGPGHGPHLLSLFRQDGAAGGPVQLPQADGSVAAAGDGLRTVRGDGHAPDGVGVAGEAQDRQHGGRARLGRHVAGAGQVLQGDGQVGQGAGKMFELLSR